MYFMNPQAPAKYLHEYEPEQSKEGLFVSRLRLNFQLAQSHFISGELRLKCVASMVAFYHETNEHSQQAPTKAEEPPVKEVRNLPEEGSLVTTESMVLSGAMLYTCMCSGGAVPAGTSGSTSVWTSPPFTLMLYAVLITAAHLLY
ncbi:hypothetical protein GWK47_035574 [Chionoecetes opilio]|uniref:Uncharacterized protein n=1 Tax=Chionoecetes opilio TaxID=41210 RepID=A0A8J5D349_CHIOP|nr:hypothetical protein GWK47_035574 [Chionoecetes opilio]